jgi:hypothetical protein
VWNNSDQHRDPNQLMEMECDIRFEVQTCHRGIWLFCKFKHAMSKVPA